MGELAEDCVNGFCCSWCGIYFKEPYEYPVICKGCFRDFSHEYPSKKIAKKELLKKHGLQVALWDK